MFNTDEFNKYLDESSIVTSPKTCHLNDALKQNIVGSKTSQRLKSAGLVHSVFASKSKLTSISSSKSVFVPASRINLPPASKCALIRSPQPLTVTGYRHDLVQNIQTNETIKTKSHVKYSSNSFKISPTKSVSLRWKVRPGTNPRGSQYADPLMNADSAYLQRMSEMASLEAETIKYEKTRKFKRK